MEAENPLVFYWSPESLQAIAAKQIAVRLLRREIFNFKPTEDDIMSTWWIQQLKIDVCGLLRIPLVIGDVINESVKECCSRIVQWTLNLDRDVFEWSAGDYIAKCFDLYVATDNDKIVARKLLESDLLKPVEKYKLACKFCWKNDIEQWWPSVMSYSHITGAVFISAPMLYFWNCAMMNVPFEIPGDTDESIEYRMVARGLLDDQNWTALEYFWDKLNAEERSTIVIAVLERGKEKILINILPKLNEIELNLLQGHTIGHVLGTLAVKAKYFDYVLRIWSYFYKLSSCSELEAALFHIWRMVFEPGRLTYEDGRQASIVLHELWIRLPIALKQSFISFDRADKVFNRLSDIRVVKTDVSKIYGRDMAFMMEILKSETISNRNEIWLLNWRKIIVRARPSCLEKLMKLCFENPDEIIHFKQTVMMDQEELEYEFNAFIDSKYFSQLLDYINFCSSDQQRVDNLKRRIIAARLQSILTPYEAHHLMMKFDGFLFAAYPDIEFAKRFRAEFVLASERVLPILLEGIDRGDLYNAVRMCNYLSYELCPFDVKSQFLNHCRKSLISGDFQYFKISEWRELVKSCAGSDENVSAFKETIPVDDIFDTLSTKMIDTLGRKRHYPAINYMREADSMEYDDEKLNIFIRLENFLIWYFGNKQAARDYKLSKFDDNRIVSLIKTMSPRDVRVDLVLKWVFECDNEKIAAFKVKYFSEFNRNNLRRGCRKRVSVDDGDFEAKKRV